MGLTAVFIFVLSLSPAFAETDSRELVLPDFSKVQKAEKSGMKIETCGTQGAQDYKRGQANYDACTTPPAWDQTSQPKDGKLPSHFDRAKDPAARPIDQQETSTKATFSFGN